MSAHVISGMIRKLKMKPKGIFIGTTSLKLEERFYLFNILLIGG